MPAYRRFARTQETPPKRRAPNADADSDLHCPPSVSPSGASFACAGWPSRIWLRTSSFRCARYRHLDVQRSDQNSADPRPLRLETFHATLRLYAFSITRLYAFSRTRTVRWRTLTLVLPHAHHTRLPYFITTVRRSTQLELSMR